MSFIDTIIKLIVTAFKLLFELIGFIMSGFQKKSGKYTGEFTPPRRIFKKRSGSFSLGGTYSLDTKAGFQHAICFGSTGYGKSVCFVVNSLYNLSGLHTGEKPQSIIVTDPSREVSKHTKSFFVEEGYKVIELNFSDKSGNISDGWNPLPEDVNDVAKFMDRIVRVMHEGNKGDQFWQIQAGALLTTLATPLYKLPESLRNMASVHGLLNILASDKKECATFMSRYADDETWREFKAYLNNSDNVQKSILSSAKACIHIFGQPHIKLITSNATFSLADIRKEPHIIYLQSDASDLVTHKLLISLFFSEVLDRTLSNLPSPDMLNLALLIDEAGIYPIDILPLAITQARKFRCSIFALLQNEAQLSFLYSPEQEATIKTNCKTKIYLTNQPFKTAKELSDIAGLTQYKDENDKEVTRPLITPDEVRSLDPDKAIVLHGHNRLSIVPLRPFFKHGLHKQLSELPQVKHKRKLPIEPVAPFPIKDLCAPMKPKEEKKKDEG